MTVSHSAQMLLKLENCIPISHVTLETVPKYANIERPTSSQLYASAAAYIFFVDKKGLNNLFIVIKVIYLCVCASERGCVRVFVTNQDIDLYNDTGMTQVLQGEGDFSGHWPMSPLFKTLINHTEWGFFGESWNAQSPVRAKFRCRVGVGQ